MQYTGKKFFQYTFKRIFRVTRIKLYRHLLPRINNIVLVFQLLRMIYKQMIIIRFVINLNMFNKQIYSKYIHKISDGIAGHYSSCIVL